MKSWCFALLAVLTVCAFAADLTTKSGVVYKDYSIEGASTNGLVIFHELGGATIPYADLPGDLRAKYKADEEKADAALKEQAEQRKKLEEQRKEAEKLKEAEVARIKEEQQKKEMEFQELKGLFGYYLGDGISESDILKKGDAIFLKAKRNDWGATDCIVKLTESGKIYLINKLFTKIPDPLPLVKKLKESFPALRVHDSEDSGFVKATAEAGDRCLEVSIMLPVTKKDGSILSDGSLQIQLIDKNLEPIEERIFKRIVQKRDDMQKVVWMESLTHVKYKKDNLEFWVNPYVGKFDNGEIRLRMKTRYVSKRQEYSNSKWIFYDKIQFLNDRKDEVFLTIEQPEKQSEVEDFGLTEWADVLVGEKLLKLKNSKSITVKFYGKYSQEFSLTDEQCQAFNEIFNLYEYLKSQK